MYVRFGLLIVVLLAAFLLLREHSAHVAFVVPFLPLLLLLACPLMHLFMHHGHSHHGDSQKHRQNKQT